MDCSVTWIKCLLKYSMSFPALYRRSYSLRRQKQENILRSSSNAECSIHIKVSQEIFHQERHSRTKDFLSKILSCVRWVKFLQKEGFLTTVVSFNKQIWRISTRHGKSGRTKVHLWQPKGYWVPQESCGGLTIWCWIRMQGESLGGYGSESQEEFGVWHELQTVQGSCQLCPWLPWRSPIRLRFSVSGIEEDELDDHDSLCYGILEMHQGQEISRGRHLLRENQWAKGDLWLLLGSWH